VGEAARNAPENASKEARKSEKTLAKSKNFAHLAWRNKKWRVTPHEARKMI
jgi:hypothetical protein